MPASKPTIYLTAGCNGAGKTTFAKEFLPHEVKCLRFHNADEMARGLSPLDPSAGAIKAGRLLLSEVRSSIAHRETFALESTLSGTTYIRIFRLALSLGYELELHYPWLATPEQAIACVGRRVRMEGTTSQWRISGGDSSVAAFIWSMTACRSRRVGLSGIAAGSSQNGSPHPLTTRQVPSGN